MSGNMKVLLLLAAAVCISAAMIRESGQSCLCQRTRDSTDVSKLKDIRIHPANSFCDNVEIVVTSGEGELFCLNPDSKAVRALLRRVLRTRRSAIKPTKSS